MQWHGKLGNLALLPATLAGAAAAGCTADWEAKAELWRAAGVRERLPGFTWPVVDPQGRYGRFRFCFNECQQVGAAGLESRVLRMLTWTEHCV